MLILLSMFAALVIAVVPQSSQVVIDVCLFVYLAIIYVNFRREKTFNIYQVWIVGFIFIVWSEMCIICDGHNNTSSYVVPFCRFILANACVLLGYNIKQKSPTPTIYTISKDNGWFPLLLIVLAAYYIYSKLPSVISVYTQGRGSVLSNTMGSGSLVGALRGAIGMLVPSMIAYYMKIVKRSLYL